MKRLSRRRLLEFAAITAAAPLVVRPTTLWAQSNEAQILVDRARIVVEQFLATPAKDDMHVYVQNAYGVMVLPDVLKGGLLIGAEYGTGVMLLRDLRTGTFGEPAFFTLAGGSFGLQIGGKSSDLLLTFMNDGAITKLLSSNFKIGTDVSATAGKLGAGIGAATTVHFGEDIYIFSREQGLYAGVSLDGSALKPKDDYDKIYYGQPVTATQILRDRSVSNAGSQQLRDALARF
ncbi:Las17-binding protein actin regulator [Arboricoccus pini]|uniref:Las17-binding protein actin regulator n=1 Tax=Arboricoccus pini TaxID=1963835 RepID=A0A212Q179_9PROT|nr:lipid-binding SYLF domain-containing protein [Arboricoccus pini]SNB53072.1 Las17-binding protein actin regulator [Arboricoccus pini]